VSLHKVTAKSYFSPLAIKPGAMMTINNGMKICSIMVKPIRVSKSNMKISPLNVFASSFDVTSFSLYIGMNTADRAPSPKILRNKLGNLKATLTQSAICVVPKVAAMKSSLASPKKRDIKVKKATIIPDLTNIYMCIYE
jgi:hypothetical protein